MLDLCCWVAQVGVELHTGVCRELDIVILTGVSTLVGVSPVLPSIRASKLRLLNTLVGVSIGIPSILRRHWGLMARLRVAGRARLARLGFDLVEVNPKASSWVRRTW